MTEEYQGEERRSEYCPVHHLKCQEWKDVKHESRTKVPIWVFKIFLGVLITVGGAILGYMNYTAAEKHIIMLESNKIVVEKLTNHMKQANNVFHNFNNTLSEFSLNQKTVMKQLKIDFQPIQRSFEHHYQEP